MIFRYWLWKIGIWSERECPYCHGELILCGVYGIEKPQYYRCKLEECDFNGKKQ